MKTLSTPLPVTPDSVIDSVYNEQTANYRPKKKPHKKSQPINIQAAVTAKHGY